MRKQKPPEHHLTRADMDLMIKRDVETIRKLYARCERLENVLHDVKNDILNGILNIAMARIDKALEETDGRTDAY